VLSCVFECFFGPPCSRKCCRVYFSISRLILSVTMTSWSLYTASVSLWWTRNVHAMISLNCVEHSMTWTVSLSRLKTTLLYADNCESDWHVVIVGIGRVNKGKRWRSCIAVNGTPIHSCGMSLAIWDHTVLLVTQHKWTHPALTMDLPTLEGWKAELTYR